MQFEKLISGSQQTHHMETQVVRRPQGLGERAQYSFRGSSDTFVSSLLADLFQVYKLTQS